MYNFLESNTSENFTLHNCQCLMRWVVMRDMRGREVMVDNFEGVDVYIVEWCIACIVT